MLELHNMTMESSNLRKKFKRTIECDKRIVKCDVGTAQYEDESVKCEKKSKRNTKCEKRIVTCNVGTTQCENETVKCEKKNKGTTKCDKKNVTYDKRTITCNKKRTDAMLVLLNITMEPSNLGKKINELLYVTKELSNVIFELHNVRM